jgi:tetraacyldisaccharide 4'-kinase
MFKLKHPQVAVAVSVDRSEGIPKLIGDYPDLDVVLLDDAYQHRAVRPGLSVLLVDYAHPFYDDFIVPSGRLRERRKHSRRADVVLITKSPNNLSDDDKEKVIKKLQPLPHQHVYFSHIQYGKRYPLFPTLSPPQQNIEVNSSGGYNLTTSEVEQPPNALLITGIANPTPLANYLATQFTKVYSQPYPDHHYFDTHDIEVVKTALFDIGREHTQLVTTEKDAVRLLAHQSWFLQNKIQLFVQPMEVSFTGADKISFEKDILAYIQHDLAKYKPIVEVTNEYTFT